MKWDWFEWNLVDRIGLHGPEEVGQVKRKGERKGKRQEGIDYLVSSVVNVLWWEWTNSLSNANRAICASSCHCSLPMTFPNSLRTLWGTGAHLTEQVDFQGGSSKPGILFDTMAWCLHSSNWTRLSLHFSRFRVISKRLCLPYSLHCFSKRKVLTKNWEDI